MKHKASGRGGRARRQRGVSGRSKTRPRRLSLEVAGRIVLPLIVASLVLIILFVVPSGRGDASGPLPDAAVPNPTPINTVDPSSGKSIVEGANSVYKGYTIGHCCANGRVTWEELSEKKKDASIRRFLRSP